MLRNFWAQITADGGLPVATGPGNGEGGIAIELLRRGSDGMQTAVRVIGKRESDTLTLDVIVDGDTVYHERTPIEG